MNVAVPKMPCAVKEFDNRDFLTQLRQVDLTKAEEHCGTHDQQVAQPRIQRVDSVYTSENAAHEYRRRTGICDECANHTPLRQSVVRHQEMSEYSGPKRERCDQNPGVASGCVVLTEIHERGLYREQNPKTNSGNNSARENFKLCRVTIAQISTTTMPSTNRKKPIRSGGESSNPALTATGSPPQREASRNANPPAPSVSGFRRRARWGGV